LMITGLALVYAGNKVESIFPWHTNTHLRFGIGSLINLVIGMGFFSLLGSLYQVLFHAGYKLREFAAAYYDPVLKLYILVFVGIIAFTVIDFAVHSYKKYATGQIETARIMREQLNLQFEALKKQMSPHFLFNSLNTISSLIYRSKDLAELFIRKLARTYRSVLEYHDRHLIPLSAELELVESYGYLMSVRYEKAMEISMEVGEANHGWLVPPLSIQMLVENAIKHNQLSHDNPLRIEIYHEDGYLFVRNNFIGQPRYIKIENNLLENPVTAGSHRIGLENIKRRYYYLTKKEIVIEKNAFFKVGIPLLKSPDER
jgi:two-component system LytT family sensor kinase